MNLLDNWDFTNPVNQRGIAVNTDRNDTGYFIDRWVNWTGSSGFKITSEGLQLYANSDIFQIMDKNLLGETVTFSICTADGIYNATFTGPSSVPSENIVKTQVINNIEFIFTILSNGNFQAALKPKKSVLVLAAKLELGEVSTLKNDALGVSYAEELIKCKRYLWRISAKSNEARLFGACVGHGDLALASILLPDNFRKTDSAPIIEYSNLSHFDLIRGIESKSITGITTSGVTDGSVTVDIYSSGVGTDSAYAFRMQKGSWIQFSKEL